MTSPTRATGCGTTFFPSLRNTTRSFPFNWAGWPPSLATKRHGGSERSPVSAGHSCCPANLCAAVAGRRVPHPDDRAVAFELERLRSLEPAMRRRILRWAASELGLELDFDQTARLMLLCAPSSDLRRVDLTASVVAQRTARELQLQRSHRPVVEPAVAVELPVPGMVAMEAAGLVFEASLAPDRPGSRDPIPPALIRNTRAGDRITLRHTNSPKKVKEVFERLRVPAEERDRRMLVSWEGQILWMEGVDLDPSSYQTPPFQLEVRKLTPLTCSEGCGRCNLGRPRRGFA